MPALVDCHTHLVFAGSRHAELARRLKGESYAQIAASGGGIKSSVEATRAASFDSLLRLACERIEIARSFGVGTIEVKSGYGLDWATEKKLLAVVQRLAKRYRNKITIQATFLGAHAFPPNCKSDQDRDAYVGRIVDQMLPEVARARLADACDVFFDQGYFNAAQSRRILERARSLGLKIKLHADELANTGGAALAADLGALSADHLLCADPAGLRKMAEAGVVAVLLPTTALYLGIPYASVEKMREAGVCMALATDFNPGSSPTQNLPFAMSLACLASGMTMPEAIAAATYGGARALGLEKTHGSIAVGARSRLAMFRCESYQQLISQFAHPGLCETLIGP